ncbi:hypothetical protein [Sorangium sp. So ce1389]|uniref:hypothetical protein n=1 Tax=Sorangium sp. So ce1389 TaxID=3133336 RepID=UPI003F5E1485
MLFNLVATYAKMISSELRGAAKAVLVNLSGISDLDGEEGSRGEVLYGALGVVARPKPAGADGFAEVVGLKTSDGIMPIAARDLRLNARVNPKEGEVLLVGYGGGFISLKDNADGDGTDIVFYATKSDGSKASAISLNTTTSNSHIALMHDSGVSVTLTKEGKAVIASPDGGTYIEVSDAGIVLNGQVQLTGSLVVGDPATALPVGLGASAPSISTILKASTA